MQPGADDIIAEYDIRGNIIITFTADTFFEPGNSIMIITNKDVKKWLKNIS